MKLQTTKRYLQELDAANRRYDRMLEVFNAFRNGASKLAEPQYPMRGIAVESISPTKFTARFLSNAVEFMFSYDHAGLHGVVAVTTLSPEGDAVGPHWSFHFNGDGEVGEIEPRPNEGPYNIKVDTDAAEIVLGAIHIALVGKMEVA